MVQVRQYSDPLFWRLRRHCSLHQFGRVLAWRFKDRQRGTAVSGMLISDPTQTFTAQVIRSAEAWRSTTGRSDHAPTGGLVL